MPVYTFSTRTKRPKDTELVEDIKLKCDNEGKNFSALIINLLRDYHATAKVQNSKSAT